MLIKNKEQSLSKEKKILEDGGPLEQFDRNILEVIVERVIIGDKDNPYAIKFIFKNKKR